jgi:hypothetical protein
MSVQTKTLADGTVVYYCVNDWLGKTGLGSLWHRQPGG